MGRPTLYDPKYNELAFRLSLLGLRDEDMASVLGISPATLDNWKINHPDFLGAINEGKAPSDAKVAASQLKRAQGFFQEVEEVYIVHGKPKKVKVNKYFAPSDTAGIFWLKNRQREIWRDTVRQEQTGAGGGPIKSETQQTISIIDASTMEPEAREALRVALKAAKG